MAGPSFPKSAFENKTEREGEFRENKRKLKRKLEAKGDRGKWRQQAALHHGPSVARTKEALLFGSLDKAGGGFFAFAFALA